MYIKQAHAHVDIDNLILSHSPELSISLNSYVSEINEVITWINQRGLHQLIHGVFGGSTVTQPPPQTLIIDWQLSY